MMLVNGVIINPFTSRQPEGNPTAQFNTNKVPVFIAIMLFKPSFARNTTPYPHLFCEYHCRMCEIHNKIGISSNW
jgi:hypothetical protein